MVETSAVLPIALLFLLLSIAFVDPTLYLVIVVAFVVLFLLVLLLFGVGPLDL